MLETTCSQWHYRASNRRFWRGRREF